MTKVIDKINEKEIVKEQLADENKNVFTGTEFTTSTTFVSSIKLSRTGTENSGVPMKITLKSFKVFAI